MNLNIHSDPGNGRDADTDAGTLLKIRWGHAVNMSQQRGGYKAKEISVKRSATLISNATARELTLNPALLFAMLN